jgi:type IV conjugative transfer system coupling protein TraD
MLNDFIGGGQVFLHKIRMFLQVFYRTIHISLLGGIILAVIFTYGDFRQVKWNGFFSYQKALVAQNMDEILSDIFARDGKAKTHINAQLGDRIWSNIEASRVLKMGSFKEANNRGWSYVSRFLVILAYIVPIWFLIVFIAWGRFGRTLKKETKNEGSGSILSADQVRRKLKSLKLASSFVIGKMPLVKNMENSNFLVTGAVGSGKTNLMHNLLPQIEAKNQPVVVIDNTGEMIAKYYNKERGDIIFNPFDKRSHMWDFWSDCSKAKNLEKFADILIGFNSRKNNYSANDFWEESAQSIVVDTINVFKKQSKKNNNSIESLYKLLMQNEHKEMYKILKGTSSGKYFVKENEKTASSIMSVLMTNVKPMRFLKDKSKVGMFSIGDYLQKINSGGNSWLFLSTDPSARELTIPLNASLLELLISRMRATRTNVKHNLWIVMDELPALGKLPSLTQLMQEGRKYGSCVLAAMQSISQLYKHYGEADASNLIGLFKTKFAFASDDPKMGDLYSKLCGSVTTIGQQKNISFGANEFRDGVSYNERKEKSSLVSYEDFGKLAIGECYAILPVSEVRLSKIQVPRAKIPDKNSWFIETEEDLGKIEQPVLQTKSAGKKKKAQNKSNNSKMNKQGSHLHLKDQK